MRIEAASREAAKLRPAGLMDTERREALLAMPRARVPAEEETPVTGRVSWRAPEPWEADLLAEVRHRERRSEMTLLGGLT